MKTKEGNPCRPLLCVLLSLVIFIGPQGCCSLFSSRYERVTVDSTPTGIPVFIDGREYRTPADVQLFRGKSHEAVFPNGSKVIIHSIFAGNPMWLNNFWFLIPGIPFGIGVGYMFLFASAGAVGWILAGLGALIGLFFPNLVANLLDWITGASFNLGPDKLYYIDGKVYAGKGGKLISGSK